MMAVLRDNLELLDPATAYERWAPTYDTTANALLALEERIVAPRMPRLDGRVVVDLGCGTGRWTSYARSRGARAFGLDASPAMLAEAKAKPELAGALVCADMAGLPFADRCADVVICSFALSYVADLAGFAAQLRRICRPGGAVLITDLHPDASKRGWRRTFQHRSHTFEIATHQHSLPDILNTLRRAGLRVDAVLEPAIGDPERDIFTACGKPDLFDRVAGEPALAIVACTRPLAAGTTRRSSTLVLQGARVALGPDQSAPLDVGIRNGRIDELAPRGQASLDGQRIDCSGMLLLPGLINAHDHLEFNLFPRLGNGPYRNFAEWAEAIYRPEESPIREHRAVPKEARLRCGGLKNLLCGATTVSHHNDFLPEVFTRDFPVRVVRCYRWAHSFVFDDVGRAFRQAPPGWPVIVHLGEGTDHDSRAELLRLREMGALGPGTVIVHGVAFSEEVAVINQAGAAVVWCPSSNCFTLGTTLGASVTEGLSRIALGTDSAISGAGDLLVEIRFAHAQRGATPAALYRMVTTGAADVLRLGSRFGRIEAGAVADFVILRDRGKSPGEALVSSSSQEVEAVMIAGRPRLLSPSAAGQWESLRLDLRPIEVEGLLRLVPPEAADAVAVARAHLGSIRIAGKRVTS